MFFYTIITTVAVCLYFKIITSREPKIEYATLTEFQQNKNEFMSKPVNQVFNPIIPSQKALELYDMCLKRYYEEVTLQVYDFGNVIDDIGDDLTPSPNE